MEALRLLERFPIGYGIALLPDAIYRMKWKKYGAKKKSIDKR